MIQLLLLMLLLLPGCQALNVLFVNQFNWMIAMDDAQPDVDGVVYICMCSE